jgi:1-phosphofructokinase
VTPGADEPGTTDAEAGEEAEPDASTTAICVFAPVLLLTVTVETRGEDGAEIHVHCGGQGYWLARMARILGAEPVMCTVLGGETGQVIEALIEDGIALRKVAADQATPGYVHDRREGERVEVVRTVAEPFGRHEQDELHNLTLGEAAAARTCVLAGTQESDALPPEMFQRMAADLQSLGVDIIADLAGPFLAAALDGGVDLVKISDEELVADGWADSDDEADVRRGIEKMRGAGARDVVVSRREHGVLAWYGDRLLRARAPELTVADPRGAGDSMTAALAVARARGLGPEDALRLATAAAAVNVTRHGLASGCLETIDQLAPHVVIEPVE